MSNAGPVLDRVCIAASINSGLALRDSFKADLAPLIPVIMLVSFTRLVSAAYKTALPPLGSANIRERS